MLTATSFTRLIIAAAAIQAAACVVTSSPDGDGGFGGFGAGTSNSVAATTTNASTTTTATSVSSTSTGSGQCAGPTGTGVAVSACDEMGYPSMCSDTSEPVGLTTCRRGFELFESGPWEILQSCLANIPADTDHYCGDPTAENYVVACENDMYDAACFNQDVSDKCDEIAASCTDPNDAFATATCKSDMNPFSTDGFNEYLDCINNSGDVSCADLHDSCLTNVLGG